MALVNLGGTTSPSPSLQVRTGLPVPKPAPARVPMGLHLTGRVERDLRETRIMSRVSHAGSNDAPLGPGWHQQGFRDLCPPGAGAAH